MSKNLETPSDKFKRIASSRTQKIIDMIRLLGNCSNTYVYEYTDDEVKKIFDAIEIELRNTKLKYKENSSTNKKFTL